MDDDREKEMLDLMRECQMTLRRCENKLNEIWAEWTRTHIVVPRRPDATKLDAAKEMRQIAEHTRNTVKRVLR